MKLFFRTAYSLLLALGAGFLLAGLGLHGWRPLYWGAGLVPLALFFRADPEPTSHGIGGFVLAYLVLWVSWPLWSGLWLIFQAIDLFHAPRKV